MNPLSCGKYKINLPEGGASNINVFPIIVSPMTRVPFLEIFGDTLHEKHDRGTVVYCRGYWWNIDWLTPFPITAFELPEDI